MAYSQGVAQIVHITTYVGAVPTQPTNPVVTVSLDGGATFEAPDNSAATTLYGISLLLSAAETGRTAVQVRVASDNCALAVQTFYFEDNYTAVRAALLDNLDVAISDVQGPTGKNLDDVIAAVQGGTGAATVILYVMTDEDTPQPVPGAAVTIPGAGMQLTDAAGATTWHLDNGTYAVTIRSNGFYEVADSYSVVIADGAISSPAGGILSVTPQTIAEPANPDVCRCYLYMYHSNGITPLGAGDGTLRVTEVVQRPATATVVYDDDYNADAPAETNADGYVYVDLPRGMVCKLTASWPDRGERTALVTVPDSATQNLANSFQDAASA